MARIHFDRRPQENPLSCPSLPLVTRKWYTDI